MASAANVALSRGRGVLLRLDGRPIIVARPATTRLARLRGLLFRQPPIAGEGMLLARCGSVHTCLMRYAIDVVYLDDELRVVKVAPRVRQWRFSFGGRQARHALELAAGEAARLGFERGVQFTLNGVRA